MSKIFDAYKKRAGDNVDLTVEVGRAGVISLYPPPTGTQQADFTRLANRLLDLRLETRGTILGFASSAAGEGSSFVSYNSAMVLAQVYHMKVAWIDGNLLSPQAKLRGKGGLTFSALLQDPLKADNLIVDANPFLLEGGANLISIKGSFADSKYPELLLAVANRFDFVIMDLPPVLASSDTSLMASACDGFLLTIEQKYLKWEVIEHGIQSLKGKGVQVLGSVINRRKFDLPKVIYDRL